MSPIKEEAWCFIKSNVMKEELTEQQKRIKYNNKVRAKILDAGFPESSWEQVFVAVKKISFISERSVDEIIQHLSWIMQAGLKLWPFIPNYKAMSDERLAETYVKEIGYNPFEEGCAREEVIELLEGHFREKFISENIKS